MKQVSIKDLKAGVAAAVAEAEAGRPLLVTRHNRPVAILGPAHRPGVHRGAAVGKGGLTPAVKTGTAGRVFAVLADDRADR
jgi:antitoxin (DNA-binding transcriptional repressor) of toxin-antitoxin stability system